MGPRRPDRNHEAGDLAAGLPPLLVAAERVAVSVLQGVHGRRRVGPGETFWQFRRYQPGDSARLIDWRRSARSRNLFVRETEWEAAQSVWLWRDASPSMAFRSTKAVPKKSERANLLLLALASLLVRGGERVALLGAKQGAASGQAALHRLAVMIENGPTDSLPEPVALPRHASLVLMGDFLSPLDDVGETVSRFARHGVRGHLLQILDPAEETLDYSGRVLFRGPEKEGDVLIGQVDSVRSDYRAAMAAHGRGVAALARAHGWTFTAHGTNRPPRTALLALFTALSGDLDQC